MSLALAGTSSKWSSCIGCQKLFHTQFTLKLLNPHALPGVFHWKSTAVMNMFQPITSYLILTNAVGSFSVFKHILLKIKIIGLHQGNKTNEEFETTKIGLRTVKWTIITWKDSDEPSYCSRNAGKKLYDAKKKPNNSIQVTFYSGKVLHISARQC